MEADVATHKITPVTVPFASAATQSAPFLTKDAIAGYVQNPAAVDAGNLSFELSEDGVNFYAAVPAILVTGGVAANARVPIPALALSARYGRLITSVTTTAPRTYIVYLKS